MRNEVLFRDKPVWTAILTLVIPAVLTILIMVIYNLADMFFIAMLGDDGQVAAVSLVSPVFSLANALGTMIGAGGCAAIAKVIGEKKKEDAETMFSLCVWSSICFGVLYSAVLLVFSDPLLRFLGTTEELMGSAGAYMRVLAAGSPFMLFSVATASAIRAEGIIIPGMLSNIAGTLVNVVLDPLFILVLHLGIKGAAAATVLGNITACIFLVRAIRKHSDLISFTPAYALRRPLLLFTILLTGLPNGISTTLSGIASTFSNRLLNQYGSGAIASMAAASRSVLVITMVQMGICLGVSPLLAYNCGAGNWKRLKEALIKTGTLAVGFGLTAALICFGMGDRLIALFLKDSENLALGRSMMTWLIAASPLLGFYYLSSNFLQASGKPIQATVLSVLRQGVLLIICLFVFEYLFGLIGIAAAHTAADLLSIVIAVILGVRQYRAVQRESYLRPAEAIM